MKSWQGTSDPIRTSRTSLSRHACGHVTICLSSNDRFAARSGRPLSPLVKKARGSARSPDFPTSQFYHAGGAMQLDEEPAVVVGRLSSPPHPAPHDDQLMSEHRVLSFKPQLRLECRCQEGVLPDCPP